MERWFKHSAMTNPGTEAHRLADLPVGIDAMCGIIQGLLLHAECMAAYGLPDPAPTAFSRDTLPLSERFARVAKADTRPFTLPRAAADRSLGTCRDFALMLCGLLREQGVAARVRCGFASYFTGGTPWADHWICEYWEASENRWKKADPQLDDVLKSYYSVPFDATNMPCSAFMTAGEAWLRCRSGQFDPAIFGHGPYRGLWFIRVNVVRDHYSMNDQEVSPWDTWRQADDAHRRVLERELEGADFIARSPDAPLVPITPPWLL
jgi:transglutaminase-like putative cysteine protease